MAASEEPEALCITVSPDGSEQSVPSSSRVTSIGFSSLGSEFERPENRELYGPDGLRTVWSRSDSLIPFTNHQPLNVQTSDSWDNIKEQSGPPQYLMNVTEARNLTDGSVSLQDHMIGTPTTPQSDLPLFKKVLHTKINPAKHVPFTSIALPVHRYRAIKRQGEQFQANYTSLSRLHKYERHMAVWEPANYQPILSVMYLYGQRYKNGVPVSNVHPIFLPSQNIPILLAAPAVQAVPSPIHRCKYGNLHSSINTDPNGTSYSTNQSKTVTPSTQPRDKKEKEMIVYEKIEKEDDRSSGDRILDHSVVNTPIGGARILGELLDPVEGESLTLSPEKVLDMMKEYWDSSESESSSSSAVSKYESIRKGEVSSNGTPESIAGVHTTSTKYNSVPSGTPMSFVVRPDLRYQAGSEAPPIQKLMTSPTSTTEPPCASSCDCGLPIDPNLNKESSDSSASNRLFAGGDPSNGMIYTQPASEMIYNQQTVQSCAGSCCMMEQPRNSVSFEFAQEFEDFNKLPLHRSDSWGQCVSGEWIQSMQTTQQKSPTFSQRELVHGLQQLPETAFSSPIPYSSAPPSAYLPESGQSQTAEWAAELRRQANGDTSKNNVHSGVLYDGDHSLGKNERMEQQFENMSLQRTLEMELDSDSDNSDTSISLTGGYRTNASGARSGTYSVIYPVENFSKSSPTWHTVPAYMPSARSDSTMTMKQIDFDATNMPSHAFVYPAELLYGKQFPKASGSFESSLNTIRTSLHNKAPQPEKNITKSESVDVERQTLRAQKSVSLDSAITTSQGVRATSHLDVSTVSDLFDTIALDEGRLKEETSWDTEDQIFSYKDSSTFEEPKKGKIRGFLAYIMFKLFPVWIRHLSCRSRVRRIPQPSEDPTIDPK